MKEGFGKMKTAAPNTLDNVGVDISDDDIVIAPFLNKENKDKNKENKEKHEKESKILTSPWTRIRTFVAVYAVYGLLFVTLEMYIAGVITTIEKKFGLTSSQSGSLLSIKEIVIVCTASLISHFARNANKPRCLAAMGILAALGGLISGLCNYFILLSLHFLYDP